MTKTTPILATALLFALMLAAGTAFAGGPGCDKDKKGEEGGSAAVSLPAQPLA